VAHAKGLGILLATNEPLRARMHGSERDKARRYDRARRDRGARNATTPGTA